MLAFLFKPLGRRILAAESSSSPGDPSNRLDTKMNFEMNNDQVKISTPWGFSTLGEVEKLSPISQEAVMDWNCSSASFESFRWKNTPGLEDHFVGVLSDVTVYNAQAWLPKELVKGLDWQVDQTSNTATIDALVIAVSEDLLIERINQTSTLQSDDLQEAWIDYVLNVVLYKPGLKLATPQDAIIKRLRLRDMMLADFAAPMFLPEDEYTAQLQKVKVGRANRFAKKGFCLEILGDPEAKIALEATFPNH